MSTSNEKAIAEAEKKPTGPATSADRYFYEAGFKAGRQQGMKQEQELDYKAIGQQAYESGYTTGYMDGAIKAHEAQQERRSDSEQLGETVAEKVYDQEDDTAYIQYFIPHDLIPIGTKFYTTPQQRKPLEPTVPEDANINQRISFKAGWKAAEAAHGITSDTDFKE